MRFNFEWEGVILDIGLTFIDEGHDYYFDHIYLEHHDGDTVEVDLQNIIILTIETPLSKAIDGYIWDHAEEYAENERQEALEALL